MRGPGRRLARASRWVHGQHVDQAEFSFEALERRSATAISLGGCRRMCAKSSSLHLRSQRRRSAGVRPRRLSRPSRPDGGSSCRPRQRGSVPPTVLRRPSRPTGRRSCCQSGVRRSRRRQKPRESRGPAGRRPCARSGHLRQWWYSHSNGRTHESPAGLPDRLR